MARHWILLAAILAACSSTANTPISASPATPPLQPPGLTVSTNRLVDNNGSPVRLIGVDRDATEYTCVIGNGVFDGPTDSASVASMRAWHINAVRLPLNADCWLGINGALPQYSGSNYQKAIADYVSQLRHAGMYVILDLHSSTPGTVLAQDTLPTQGMLPMPDQDHAPTFWKQVASVYSSDTSVIFDLFNEPYPDHGRDTTAAWQCIRDGGNTCTGLLIDQAGKTWNYDAAGMQSLVDAVRSTGASNVLMISGPSWSNTLDHWLEYRPHDPLNKIAASWHSYNDSDCIGVNCWDAQIAPTAAQVPLITGELGEKDCSTAYIVPLLAWLDAHQSSYLAWSWNTGPDQDNLNLITDYSGTPSCYGAQYRDYLARQQNQTPH